MSCQWWFGTKCKPGLQLAFAQTWSSLSRALFPYASAPEARPGLSTFNSFWVFKKKKNVCFYSFLPLIFSHLQRRRTLNLSSFISFHSEKRTCLINKVLFFFSKTNALKKKRVVYHFVCLLSCSVGATFLQTKVILATGSQCGHCVFKT